MSTNPIQKSTASSVNENLELFMHPFQAGNIKYLNIEIGEAFASKDIEFKATIFFHKGSTLSSQYTSGQHYIKAKNLQELLTLVNAFLQTLES